MKELSIEQKAKRYDELLVKLQEAKVDNNVCDERYCCVIDDIVPELRESEDEKIRKGIIRNLEYLMDRAEGFVKDELKERIAWLEKKGEQKPTDKIEPKFKVGQWIVWRDKCYKVNYNGCGYELIDQNGLSTSLEYGTVDDNAHIYDITKDAKDGDVIAYNDGSLAIFHYRLSGLDTGLYMSHVLFTDKIELKQTCAINNVHPATKEQRDTLMKAISDAGYIFDFEKKELRKLKFRVGNEIKTINEEPLTITKIDKKGYWSEDLFICGFDSEDIWDLVKQKPAGWNEEDESILNDIIHNIHFAETHRNVTGSFDMEKEQVNWLKSLKLYKQWKPSDEHYELEEFAKIVRGNLTGISKAVQELFEAKYLQLTGNKMYGGFKD